jgi:hypothetical protein
VCNKSDYQSKPRLYSRHTRDDDDDDDDDDNNNNNNNNNNNLCIISVFCIDKFRLSNSNNELHLEIIICTVRQAIGHRKVHCDFTAPCIREYCEPEIYWTEDVSERHKVVIYGMGVAYLLRAGTERMLYASGCYVICIGLPRQRIRPRLFRTTTARTAELSQLHTPLPCPRENTHRYLICEIKNLSVLCDSFVKFDVSDADHRTLSSVTPACTPPTFSHKQETYPQLPSNTHHTDDVTVLENLLSDVN